MFDRLLAAPFPGIFRLSRGWGAAPEYYARFKYDGVALKGHNGLDFALPIGTPILAIDAGWVLREGYEAGGFGNYIKIRHEWGESLYAHLDSLPMMGMGQRVGKGQQIGTSGNTGGSTGPHLHFGIRVNPYKRNDGWGGFCDPMPHLDPDCYTMGRGMDEDEDAPSPMGEIDRGRP
ncbi:MAG: peptidoglycan DD-metalloendopeptidase family protein [Caldilineaceae bacterium]|nr:peptidoglycan DD-metalloendopeptidase family protein [Caldilineaceae bacterium]